MQNGFDGIVNGLYTVPNCIMIDLGTDTNGYSDCEIMRSYSGGRSFCLLREEDYRSDRGKAVCRCHALRMFGIGLVGGGVLCKVIRLLGNAGICFYGASVSECGITLALPCEKLTEAVRILSAKLLEDRRT